MGYVTQISMNGMSWRQRAMDHGSLWIERGEVTMLDQEFRGRRHKSFPWRTRKLAVLMTTNH